MKSSLKKTIQKTNETKGWFFEKTNKIDKPEKKRECQINKIRNERGEVTTGTIEIQRIVRNYYKELYAKKFENLDEMDNF